jgi:hypothetical protein
LLHFTDLALTFFFLKLKRFPVYLVGLGIVDQPLDSGVVLLGHVLVDDNHGSSDNLVGLSVLIVGAQTGPFSELLSVRDTQQMGSVLSAEGLHNLDVVSVVARLGQDAEQSLTRVQNTARLTQSTVQGVGPQGLLQGLLDGIIQLESLLHGLLLLGGLQRERKKTKKKEKGKKKKKKNPFTTTTHLSDNNLFSLNFTRSVSVFHFDFLTEIQR